MIDKVNQPMIGMFDVRGIQNYIFRTNKVQEIMGASELIEHLIKKGLEKISKEEAHPEQYILEWENFKNDEIEFLNNSDIQMQILFIGGGNAYALYRNEEVKSRINRKLAKYVLEETYSLQLATVSTSTQLKNYLEDYQELQAKMGKVKAKMILTHPVGALPIGKIDELTGFPISKKRKIYNANGKIEEAFLSTESYLKRKQVPEEERLKVEKIFDHMVLNKGDNSMLAIVHIDGNNLGGRIRNIVENNADKESFEQAVKKVRTVSANIKASFLESFHAMEKQLEEWTKWEDCPFGKKRFFNDSENNNQETRKKFLRKIIIAGDDITFVCNASLAFPLVEYFLKNVSEKVMFGNAKTDLIKYGLSACAGIAFIHSHFPFSEGYKIAEACCDQAKSRAKKSEYKGIVNKEPTIIGNWIDFQVCRHIASSDFETDRENEYRLMDGNSLLKRPYYVPYSNALVQKNKVFGEMNEQGKDFSYEEFKQNHEYFKSLPRSQAKALRNAYAFNQQETQKYVDFLLSRNCNLPNEGEAFTDRIANWYDVLETMDLYEAVDFENPTKEGEANE